MLEFEGRIIDTDAQGYLKNSDDWSEALAPVIAAQEEITLTEPHWEVVQFVRDFYQEFNTSPAIRMLVKAMSQKYGEEKGTAATCIAFSRKALRNKRPKLQVYLYR